MTLKDKNHYFILPLFLNVSYIIFTLNEQPKHFSEKDSSYVYESNWDRHYNLHYHFAVTLFGNIFQKR